MEAEEGVSEGRHTMTWIWRTGSVGDSEGAARESKEFAVSSKHDVNSTSSSSYRMV